MGILKKIMQQIIEIIIILLILCGLLIQLISQLVFAKKDCVYQTPVYLFYNILELLGNKNKLFNIFIDIIGEKDKKSVENRRIFTEYNKPVYF